MPKMLSTRQVQEELHKRVNLDYSLQHISYLIKQGCFPGSVKGLAKNSHWRIPESALEAFIASIKIAGKEPIES